MINRAIEFATACHSGQTRKGTSIPYILHCLEAGTIAASLTNKDNLVDEDVVASAILHDTIEDAGVTYEELAEVFNDNIVSLVKSQSEDKTKDWKSRKQSTIDFLRSNKSKDVEIATLSDKLSNMRAISKDYDAMGDNLWEKFNAGRSSQHWYYRSIGVAITQLKDTNEHKEYMRLVERVFNS